MQIILESSQNSTLVEVDFVNNSIDNPYSKTYNPGWRDHPWITCIWNFFRSLWKPIKPFGVVWNKKYLGGL
jgi:hypothetical protein